MPREFNLLTGTDQYNSVQSQLRNKFIGNLPIQGAFGQFDIPASGLLGYNLTHLQTESDKFNAEDQRQRLEQERKAREDQIRSVNEQFNDSIGGIKGDADTAIGQARLMAALRSGRLSTLGASGLNAPALAQLQLQASLADIQGSGGAKQDELQATIYALQGKGQGLLNAVPGGGPDYAETMRQLQEKQGELEQNKIDMETKSIDALSKFNEAIDKTRQQIENEFGSGFASIVLGAQNRGAAGAQAAFKSMWEGQESTILKNIGGMAFRNSGITGVSPDSPWAGVLKGTLFGPQGQQQLINVTDVNTQATIANTQALITATTHFGNGGGSATILSGGGGLGLGNVSLSDLDNLPVTTGATTFSSLMSGGANLDDLPLNSGGGTFASMVMNSAASVSSGVAQAIGAPIAATGSILGKLANALGGAKYVGNLDALGFLGGSGMVYNPNGTPASVSTMTASDGSTLYNYDAGTQYTTLSTGQQVGAFAADVGAAVAAYQGVATATKGGAKNITGGVGESLLAVAPFTGPGAPFVAAAGTALELTSAFLPDLKTQRQKQIQNAIFQDQYLAPQAMNITESGNGSYADLNQFGAVRTSNFSPYPIISNAYLDVPRKTVVPGHTISSFGGYQNETGAKNPQVPTYNLNITAMDSKSIMDHAGAITDAVHYGMQKGNPALLSTLRQQLGT